MLTLFGGFAVEGLEFAGAIRRTSGWPWRQQDEPGLGPYLVSVIIRLGISAGLTTAVAASNQVSGPFGAVTIGAGAPLIFEQMVRHAAGSADAERGTSTHSSPRSVKPSPDGLKTDRPKSVSRAKERP
jgi:CO/xanthine dehydrogenase Mo-binding subunit